MEARKLLPDARGLHCDDITWSHGAITLSVKSTRVTACCPLCGTRSNRVHSWYWRSLADLPVTGTKVAIRWHSRRFFCTKRSCERRIFTERLEKVARSNGRRTARLDSILQSIGASCGGQGGARLAERLGISTSPSTLLREIHRMEIAEWPAPRVVGVDDWAWRKGQRYGTVLVDLEKHEPIDLLPDRSAESFSDWLKSHPSVEVISRDRGDSYIRGATVGAPDAEQVADRFHVIVNLREAIKRLLDRFPSELTAAARTVMERNQTKIKSNNDAESHAGDQKTGVIPMTPAQRNRKQLFERVKELHSNGHSRREIAKRLGIHRTTVGRFVEAEVYPERATRAYATAVDIFADYLRHRWQEGNQNARSLTKEIEEKGYTGSYWMVRRFVSGWRNGEPQSPPRPRIKKPSTQRVSGLFVAHAENLSVHDVDLLKEVKRQCPEAKTAARLATQFLKMMRQQGSEPLDRWIDRVSTDPSPKELCNFAIGLRKDIQAIRNAMDLPWSNGPTEGFINRLKLLKRQMYGRAGFSLLRNRFLAAA